jgi:hypothetical protein
MDAASGSPLGPHGQYTAETVNKQYIDCTDNQTVERVYKYTNIQI